MPTDNNEGRHEQKTRSKDAIIAAIAVVLAAVIGAAGTIIAATNRAKDTLEQRVAALQEELAVKTHEAKTLASNMAELQSGSAKCAPS